MQLTQTPSRFIPTRKIDVHTLLLGPRETFFLLAHIPLALLMHIAPVVASIHGWATAGVAIIIAIRSRRVESLIYTAAYVAGCEILWRMSQAQVFWETGKYLTIAIFAIGMLRFRSPKWSAYPALYFCLLLPGVVIALLTLSPLDAKDALSFNLSGPLAFTICALFLSRLWLAEKDLQKIFFVLLTPVVGIVTLTVFSTLTATKEVFTGTQSIMITSGGFGPNQVSAILGLAGLLCFLIFLTNQSARTVSKIILLGGWAIFTLESALTYSRGGIYMEFGAIGIASYYAFRERSIQFRLILFLLLLALLASLGTIPYLDSLTSGTFTERYSSVDSTGRDTLVLDDLASFLEHPFLGVGVGITAKNRSVLIGVVSHTEYTRLLGDHGMFGVFALVFFFFMLYQRWKEVRTARPVIASFLIWGVLFLSVYATRMVAPLLLLSIAFTTIIPDEAPLQASVVPLDSPDLSRRAPVSLQRKRADIYKTGDS